MDSKIIEKLQKIKAMQTSDKPEEVDTALKLMRKFLDKHGLTELDIPAIESGAKGVQKEQYTRQHGESKIKVTPWERNLADAISRIFECKLSFSKYSLNFYGFESDVVTTKEMYLWANKTLRNMAEIAADKAKKQGLCASKHKFKRNFLCGAAEAIEDRSYTIKQEREQAQKSQETCRSTGNSLIIVKENAIEKAMSHIKGVSINTNISDMVAYASGNSAGKKLQIGRQIK